MIFGRKVTLFLPVCALLLASFSGQRAAATEGVELAGDLVQVALPLTAWGVSHFSGDDEGFYQFTQSFAATMVATLLLKYSINETRPDGGDLSFPSGHTSASFSAASFLNRRYGLNYGIPGYIAATFVGWSRVESDRHYPHDVLAGAVLAIGFNQYFVKPQKSNLLLALAVDSQRGVVGLNLSGRW